MGFCLSAHGDLRDMSARSSASAPRPIMKTRPVTHAAQPYANVSVTKTDGASVQRAESERVRSVAPAMQLVDCMQMLPRLPLEQTSILRVLDACQVMSSCK